MARRVLESGDVWNSAVRRLVTRVRDGALEGIVDFDLRRLLLKIAHNRLADAFKKERHHAGSLPEGWEIRDRQSSTDMGGDWAEERERVLRELSADERGILEARLSGSTWAEIGELFGISEAAARMRLRRAVARSLRR